jgi:2',3'-cyclic-nucleotide 2'-phosphodiesterase (5'-nucleotidase family)
MNNAGYDAMALGNREYHFRRLVMRQKIGAALFPVLAANVVRARGADTTPLPVGSVAMKRLSSGLKVAFIGVTVPWVTREHWWRFIADTLVEDPVNTALSLATKIRPSVDIVIVLTHIGIDRDRELASRAGSLVDLIVGGHSHTPLVEPDVSCGTPIVQAGDHGRSIGIVKLEIENGATARLLAGELIPCEAPD